MISIYHILNNLDSGGAESFVCDLAESSLDTPYFNHALILLRKPSSQFDLTRRTNLSKLITIFEPGVLFDLFTKLVSENKHLVLHCHNLKAVCFALLFKFFLLPYTYSNRFYAAYIFSEKVFSSQDVFLVFYRQICSSQ